MNLDIADGEGNDFLSHNNQERDINDSGAYISESIEDLYFQKKYTKLLYFSQHLPVFGWKVDNIQRIYAFVLKIPSEI